MENNNNILEFKTIVCSDCGKEFIIAPAEQKFFINKGFEIPKRCPECRKSRREVTTITCIDCGKEVEIPNSRIQYFKENGLQMPKRCPECAAYKRSRNNG